jgi:hypothetical protein
MKEVTATTREDEVKTATPENISASRILTAAALRALEEAAERRRAAAPTASQEEIGGRGGQDPARYGDWEVKGLASDF